jgi:hypothetical protein
MGRLTLNVLLSFAQFEREVTSERIRDKIAASKRKGLWVGGMVLLGYKVKHHKVVVIKSEAERVRTTCRGCLELGSLNRLLEGPHERKVVTKVRPLSTGRTIGGIPFTRSSLGMTPSFARKAGKRYRYYVSSALIQGQAKLAGTIRTASAPKIEALVLRAVRQRRKASESIPDRDLVRDHIVRVEVQEERLVVKIAKTAGQATDKTTNIVVLHIPWNKIAMKRRREILLPPRQGRIFVQSVPRHALCS